MAAINSGSVEMPDPERENEPTQVPDQQEGEKEKELTRNESDRQPYANLQNS